METMNTASDWNTSAPVEGRSAMEESAVWTLADVRREVESGLGADGVQQDASAPVPQPSAAES